MTSRAISHRILVSWERSSSERRPPLSSLAEEMLLRHGEISDADRALVREIVFGVIRWRSLLDFHLKGHIKGGKGFPLEVMTHLRIGAYQLLFLERIPPSASVNEAVKGIKQGRHAWAAGLVNAVLRRLAEKREKLGIPLVQACEGMEGLSDEARIATETSHPIWMVRRWIKRFGLKKAEKICKANNIHPPLALRVNTIKCSRDELIRGFKEKGIHSVPGRYSRDAVIIEGWRGSPANLPFFDDGWFQVQDEASQLVSIILDPRPGERILDACAGVGGKATHIAQLMKDRGMVEAWDTNPRKLELLMENLTRLGIRSIKILKEEEFRKTMKEALSIYDRIILDAPCSGLGVIRRHPDIKWNRSEESIRRLSMGQLELLQEVAPLSKPGGKLLYSTCTFEEEETDWVVNEFTSQNPQFTICPIGKLPGSETQRFLAEKGILRLYSEKDGPDGFFVALFKKQLSPLPF